MMINSSAIYFAQHQFSASTITYILEGFSATPFDKVADDLNGAPYHANYTDLLISKDGTVSEKSNSCNYGDIRYWRLFSRSMSPIVGAGWCGLIVNFRNSKNLALLFKLKYCEERSDINTWHMSLLSSHTAIFEHALGL